MTYAEFLIVFLILPSAALLSAVFWLRKQGCLRRVNVSRHWRGVAILALIAFLWTTPWDNYLIAIGVWDSPGDRILARIGYVPLEEYAFFVLMPIFNGLIVLFLLARSPLTGGSSAWRLRQRPARFVLLLLGGLLMAGGALALRDERGVYLGWILLWFTPPLLIQWLFDPRALFQAKWIVLGGTLLPLIYFALADRYAIREGIWILAESHTIGLGLPHLPLEEFLFFGVTSLLLAQGLVLWHSLDRSNRVK